MKRWIVAVAMVSTLFGYPAAMAADPSPVATQDSNGNWSVDVPVSTSAERTTCAGGVEVRADVTAVSVTLGPDVQMVYRADPVRGEWRQSRPLTRSESRSLNCDLPAKLAHARRVIRHLRAELNGGG